LFSFILNILFPPRCLACNSYLSTNNNSNLFRKNYPLLCEQCFKNIPINNSFYCPFCHNRLPELKNFCHPQVKYILAAASSYQNTAIRETIHALKFQSVKKAAETLNQIINLYLEKISHHLLANFNNQNSVIIPVPLHPKKERKRGFNQSLLIAEILAGYLKTDIEKEVLFKSKNTPSQTEVANEKRKENVQNSFGVKNNKKIAGKNIILVDDVFTTGATLNEAVKVLKSTNVKKIIAFVIAKS